MNEPEELVVKVYTVNVTHQSNVGDEREHDEDYESCWCWEEKL